MILYTIFTIGLLIDIDNYYFLTKIKQKFIHSKWNRHNQKYM